MYFFCGCICLDLVCFGVALAGSLFWYLSIVAASGGKFVLVPIFPVSIVAASGGNLFWFLFFFVFIVAASGGKFVLVPIFPAFIVILSDGNFVFGSYFSSTNVICFSIQLF